MKRHASLTEEVLMDAIERRNTNLDNPGFCTACGYEQEGCEPDATNYECEECGANKVCAPEVILGVI